MAIPTVITDLSATIASNSPAGGDQAFPNIDDYLRAAYGFIRQGDTKASDIASAATVDLGAAVGRIVDVTGTTTITSFGTVAAGIWRIVRFTGALTLTHNATSLILPGAANITTAAGDCLIAVSLGSGNWVVTQYQRAAVEPVAANVISGTWTPTISSPFNLSSTSPGVCFYQRVGDIVSVSGSVGTQPTSAGVGIGFSISLPVAASFSDETKGRGIAFHRIGASGGLIGQTESASGNVLRIECANNATGLTRVYFSAQYQI